MEGSGDRNVSVEINVTWSVIVELRPDGITREIRRVASATASRRSKDLHRWDFLGRLIVGNGA